VHLVVVAGLIFGLLAVLSMSSHKAVITASAAGILIEKQSIGRTRATMIPVGEILALDYGAVDTGSSAARGSRLLAEVKAWASKGIIVKSRRGLFTFGEGLSGEELRYLQSIITRAVADF